MSVIANWIADHNWRLAESDDEPHCVSRARRFIEEHAIEDVTIHDVGRHVWLSTDHLGKIFKRHLRVTVGQYISAIRTENVKQVLSGQACSVADAAFATGFQSVAQFNRLFKKYTGVTSRAYRASSRSSFETSRNSRTINPLDE